MTPPDPMTDTSEPCGNEAHCDKCYPVPRWRVSQHRIQHLTNERDIKAATAEEAIRIFERGTSWPSSYDDRGGEVIQKDAVIVERIPPEEIYSFCYHDLKKAEYLPPYAQDDADSTMDVFNLAGGGPFIKDSSGGSD